MFLEGQGSCELFPYNGIKKSFFLLKKQVSMYKLLNFKFKNIPQLDQGQVP